MHLNHFSIISSCYFCCFIYVTYPSIGEFQHFTISPIIQETTIHLYDIPNYNIISKVLECSLHDGLIIYPHIQMGLSFC